MAKIGSANIALLRPEFEESNKLLTEGLKGMWGAVDPLKTAIDGNIDYLQEERVGQLQNMLQGILPQDPSDPKAMQEYMQQATSMAQDNGFNKWGINTAGAIATANSVVDRNQQVQTLFGTNQKTTLDNQKTTEERAANLIDNYAANNNLTQNQRVALYTEAGLGVQANERILKEATQTSAIANATNTSNRETVQMQATLDSLKASLEANGRFMTAQQNQELQAKIASMEYMIKMSQGGGGGKSQGLGGNTISTSAPGISAPASQQYSGLVKQNADKFGVPSQLIMAMMDTESSGDPNAVSTAGAQGLMQLMGPTADEWGKKLGLSETRSPENNMTTGTAYMAHLIQKYKGNTQQALMAYNWGMGNVDSWIKTGKGLKGEGVPRETLNYLKKVNGKLSGIGQASNASTSTAPSQNLNKTNKNIVYANENAKRNQPLNTKLTNAMSSVLQPFGVTMKVHSGGQSDTSKSKVGGPRHDHGNAADADFYIDGGKTKLSFKNPKHRGVLSAIIENAAANGVTGIGGGEGYMPDGRLHVGFGGSATWGGTDGKGAAPDWIRQAHARGVAQFNSTGGNPELIGTGDNGATGFDPTDFIRALIGTTGTPNTTQMNQENIQMLMNRIDKSKELLNSGPKVDFDSAALPDFIGNSTGKISDALAAFAPQAKFLEDDRVANLKTITGNVDANIADMGLSADMLKDNARVEDSFDTALKRAQEQAAVSGNDKLPIDSFFASPDKAKEGKALLASAGFTPEKMRTLDGKTQQTVLRTVMDYQNTIAKFKEKNQVQLEAMDKTVVKDKINAPTLKNGITLLNTANEKDIIKWHEKEGIGTWAYNSIFGTTVKNKAINTASFNTDITNRFNSIYTNNPKYHGKLTPADIEKAILLSKGRYVTELGLNDKSDAKDIAGKLDKPINPGLYGKAVIYVLDNMAMDRQKKRLALTRDPLAMPFPEMLDRAIRKDALGALGTDPDK